VLIEYFLMVISFLFIYSMLLIQNQELIDLMVQFFMIEVYFFDLVITIIVLFAISNIFVIIFITNLQNINFIKLQYLFYLMANMNYLLLY
jgi:hypothetical protein